jgi:hypothetical protein
LKKDAGRDGWELIELRCKVLPYQETCSREKTTDTFAKVARPKAYEDRKHEHLYLKLDPASVAAQVAKSKKAHEKLKITFDKEQGERTPLFFQYLILSEIRPGHLLTSKHIYRMYRF